MSSHCVVIPTYNHSKHLPMIVSSILQTGLPVIVVDDGSADPSRSSIRQLEALGATVLRHDKNLGKGLALWTGFLHAANRGFSHALQIDADGQHCLDDIDSFVDESRRNPEALVLGRPVFDSTAPRSRVWGRKLSVWLVWLETGSTVVADPLCGFRVYPLEQTMAVLSHSGIRARMDFDPEVVVRSVWSGVAVRNLSTKVSYSNGEHSNFDYVRDNLRMIALHFRLLSKRFLGGGMLGRGASRMNA